MLAELQHELQEMSIMQVDSDVVDDEDINFTQSHWHTKAKDIKHESN